MQLKAFMIWHSFFYSGIWTNILTIQINAEYFLVANHTGYQQHCYFIKELSKNNQDLPILVKATNQTLVKFQVICILIRTFMTIAI